MTKNNILNIIIKAFIAGNPVKSMFPTPPPNENNCVKHSTRPLKKNTIVVPSAPPAPFAEEDNVAILLQFLFHLL